MYKCGVFHANFDLCDCDAGEMVAKKYFDCSVVYGDSCCNIIR